jgi:hypothetical protein
MRLSNIVAIAVTGAVVLTGAGLGPANAVVPTARYGSCDDLLRDWPSGVAKNTAAANRAVRSGFYRPATSAKARKVYRAYNGNLDRDRDGTACEQTA